jgi:S-adenosylmethionine-diacylglycerol 3-amino-3-carboxypropyl transferase
MVHANNLVYNTCWEDPRLDRVALDLGPSDTIVMITSAGCNALDYALCRPRRIFAVDMNPRQNALLELKMAGIRALDHDDFFRIFGQGHHDDFDRLYAERLRPQLTAWTRRYWDRRRRWFHARRSFYFRGSSGQVARAMNWYLDKVAKVRPELTRLLSAATVEEQRAIYSNGVRERFWRPMVRRFVGHDATLAMLGVPGPQRRQVELSHDGGIATFIQRSIETVLTELPIHDNYFWRVYVTGEYTPTCCPEYLTRDGFAQLKAGDVDRITTHTDTIEGFLRRTPHQVSRFVLLDHMDWMSTRAREALAREWQAIVDSAAPETRILFRSGGTEVGFVDEQRVRVGAGVGVGGAAGRRVAVGDLLRYDRQLAARLHAKDRVHTYASFHIADLTVGPAGAAA